MIKTGNVLKLILKRYLADRATPIMPRTTSHLILTKTLRRALRAFSSGIYPATGSLFVKVSSFRNIF
jgi:hypothetical protein